MPGHHILIVYGTSYGQTAKIARRTGWQPALAVSLAGAMSYTRYNPLMRWMLRRMSRAEGGPTDTSRDHEMTDWSEVRGFADTFAALLPTPSKALTAGAPA